LGRKRQSQNREDKNTPEDRGKGHPFTLVLPA
jgi:hypothetical protein